MREPNVGKSDCKDEFLKLNGLNLIIDGYKKENCRRNEGVFAFLTEMLGSVYFSSLGWHWNTLKSRNSEIFLTYKDKRKKQEKK